MKMDSSHTIMFYLLALVGVLLAHVVTVEELSIEELNSYHSKDEVEKQVDDQDVKDVFQRVDDAVKDGFQLGNPFDGLKRPQDAKHTEGLHSTKIFTSGTSTKGNIKIIMPISSILEFLHEVHGER